MKNKGFTDSLKVRGKIDFIIRRADGSIREKWTVDNLIVTVGKALIAARLGGLTGAAATYIAVGTSTSSPAAGQTALGAEVTTSGLGRAAATVTQATTTTTNDTLVLDYTWSVTGSVTVQEIGIFNASSAGTMVGRALTGAKSVVNGETLEGTYNVIFS